MALCDATARSQRWLPWPTGTDWRCEPRSSPPRATSQWPTHDLDRPRCTLAPPPASSAFYVSKVPNRPTVLARCYSPTLPQNAALCHRFHSFLFLLSRPSLFLSISPYTQFLFPSFFAISLVLFPPPSPSSVRSSVQRCSGTGER